MSRVETAHWVEKDRRQLRPVYHPNSHANPLVIERGQGVWLYTTDDQEILDGMAGLWNATVRQSRHQWLRAIEWYPDFR